MASALGEIVFRFVEEAARPSGVSGNAGIGTGLNRVSGGMSSGIGQLAGAAAANNPYMVVPILVDTMRQVKESLDAFATRIERASPSIQREKILNDVRSFQAERYADKQIGPQLAKLVEIEGKMEAELIKLTADVLGKMLPAVTYIMETLTDLVKWSRESYNEFFEWIVSKAHEMSLWWEGVEEAKAREMVKAAQEQRARDRANAENPNFPGLDALFRDLAIPPQGNIPGQPGWAI